MQFIAQLLLQPIIEFVFHLIGYVTGHVLVPIITFGRVTVKRSRGGKLLALPPTANGKYVMEAGLAILIGVLFWIAVAVSAYVLQRP